MPVLLTMPEEWNVRDAGRLKAAAERSACDRRKGMSAKRSGWNDAASARDGTAIFHFWPLLSRFEWKSLRIQLINIYF